MPLAPSGSGTDSPLSDFGPEMGQASVIVVDDEPGMRNFLVKTLAPRCKRVEQAATVAEASALMDGTHFDIVILDNIMPGKTGIQWLAEQRRLGFFADAILITAFADLETAIQAMRAGAVDFVLKPFRSNQILNAVARCLDRVTLRRENYLLKYELASENSSARGRLLGASPILQEVRGTLARVAPLPTPVLLTGDTGTGKELAARAIHAMSDRSDRAFVPVNCAAIGAETLANELFGHIAGDGGERTDGLLLNANGGTLYFDEVAEMPVGQQAALLRVIEDNRLRPIGSTREIPLNLRFLFATNTDLEAEVAAGRFRKDFFHRINVINVRMPKLKDRIGDVSELAQMFMQKLSRSLGVPALPLEEGVVLNMTRYDWPGNVRELRNLIERSLILGEFPPEFASDSDAEASEAIDSLQAVERRHIMTVLDACGGNRAEAARRLGVSRKTVDRKCAMWNA